MFLVTSDLKQLMDSLRKVTGMIRLLRTGEQIVPLSGEEVDLLLNWEEKNNWYACLQELLRMLMSKYLMDH